MALMTVRYFKHLQRTLVYFTFNLQPFYLLSALLKPSPVCLMPADGARPPLTSLAHIQHGLLSSADQESQHNEHHGK